MPLLDRSGLKPDAYRRDDLAGDAIIVPADALVAVLANRRPGQRVGVDLPNDAGLDAVTPLPDGLDLIVIAFPKFSDGRGFSLGKTLRERGFAGTLRATGSIIPDQFAFALQCGFDEVELDDDRIARQPAADWLHALTVVDVSYQDAADGTPSIFRRRAAAR